MFRAVVGAACALAASAAPALAQEGRLSDRYEVCQAADGLDRRLDELCELVDEIHRRLEDARGQTRRLAVLRAAMASTLLAVANGRDAAAYRDCIEVARAAQVFYDADRYPTRWASMQFYIGTSLVSLGANDEAARNDGVGVLSAAIAVIDRPTQPELWATVQERLGDAYVAQSGGEDRDLLMQALAAYQAAMEIFRRPSFAERRAQLEERIAEVYGLLGQEPDPT
jgi:tetratricopeptide (TPR) repeat protein